MFMKTFTLSAVCVMVYCFMMVLTGITDLGQEDSQISNKLSLGNGKSATVLTDSRNPEVSTRPVSSGNLSATVDGGKETGAREKAEEDGRDYARRVRAFGILFILGWVVVSFKLLSSND